MLLKSYIKVHKSYENTRKKSLKEAFRSYYMLDFWFQNVKSEKELEAQMTMFYHFYTQLETNYTISSGSISMNRSVNWFDSKAV